jgi:hypothetical protein
MTDQHAGFEADDDSKTSPKATSNEALQQRIAAALDEPAAGPTATRAADPHTGLVVQPYRTDQGRPAWVFRCWGTDTCDGWLSLDHTSRQSAERARDRHAAEAHTPQPPAGPTATQATDNQERP